PGNATKVYSILAYEKAISSLQFGPGTAVAFSLLPVLVFFILLLSRFMRRGVGREDEATTWQDAVINGIGWIFGLIGTIVTFPVFLILRGINAVVPKGALGRPSKRRGALIGGLGRGLA